MFHAQPLRSLALTALFLAVGPTVGRSGTPADQTVAVTVEDFGYFDTSGEPTDQTALHQKRLEAFMAALRRDVEADQRFHVVPMGCGKPCATDGQTVDDRLRLASRAGAKILIVGGIHKI